MVAATTYTPEQKEIADAVSGEALNVAHEVAKEELRPIVRAAITDDTLRAIDKLVGLTGRMIDALEEDLDADDMVIRQRRSEEHTSELQSRRDLVCRLLLEKKKKKEKQNKREETN